MAIAVAVEVMFHPHWVFIVDEEWQAAQVISCPVDHVDQGHRPRATWSKMKRPDDVRPFYAIETLWWAGLLLARQTAMRGFQMQPRFRRTTSAWNR